MIRFTETLKWDDPWFRELAGVHKLVFLYVIDRCNNAGFWEVDEAAIVFHTKLDPKHIKGAFEALSRGLLGADGWVWVKNFLRHQKNEFLNHENNAHKQIIGLITVQSERFSKIPEFVQILGPVQGLLSPIGTGTSKGTGKKKGSAEGEKQKAHASKPTREQALAYGKEIEMDEDDINGWFDHFESNGWKISGKTPMRDWQAALRNGKRRGIGSNGTRPAIAPAKKGVNVW